MLFISSVHMYRSLVVLFFMWMHARDILAKRPSIFYFMSIIEQARRGPFSDPPKHHKIDPPFWGHFMKRRCTHQNNYDEHVLTSLRCLKHVCHDGFGERQKCSFLTIFEGRPGGPKKVEKWPFLGFCQKLWSSPYGPIFDQKPDFDFWRPGGRQNWKWP
jgi:hypothetical protein